ncbi:PAS domain S-box protein [Paenibacillus sp.]|uniref:PAS domain S-box protein n=1 Tax=Paenibacillus sp. TaxID=58172 RepID=UPI002D63219A|nr:PAS domain S-box protein [Paenibacillus sp.]HZG58290.1 PAS domain S-box protein [Paenibacillus sp.]
MDTGLLIVSFAISVVCSLFALDVTTKCRCKIRELQLCLLFMGAAVMGAGTWAVHYVAMLGSRFGALDIVYDGALLYVSLFVTIVSAYAALVAVSFPLPEGVRSFVSAVVVTMGISSLHFVGMSAMNMNAILVYDYALLFGSILFSLAANYGAFRLFIYERYRRLRYRSVWSAVLLGVSINGMHALAIEGARMIPLAAQAQGDLSGTALDESGLAKVVAIVFGTIFAITFLAFFILHRVSERLQRLEIEHKMYAGIFSNAKDAILILRADSAQTIAEVNEQACVLLGMPRKELLGAPLGQVVMGRVRRTSFDDNEEEWKFVREGRFRLAQARIRSIEVHGRETRRVAFLRDITDVKTTRAIASLFKPLSLLTVSGLPWRLLLSILEHVTPTLFPDATIRFEPATRRLAFETQATANPMTREIKTMDGVCIGRISLTRKGGGSPYYAGGGEEAWLERCADLLEMISTLENGALTDGHREDAIAGVLNQALTFEFVGLTVTYLLGYEPDDILGDPLLELFHPEDAKLFLLRIRNASELNTPCRIQVRLLHKTGSWVSMDMMLAASAHHDQAKVIFMAHISKAERPLAFLYDENQKFEFLFDYYPGSVCCLDLEGRFVRLNSGLESLTGFDAEELLGESFEKVIWPDDLEKTKANFEQAARGISLTYDIRIQRKDGGLVPLQVTNFPVVEGTTIVGVFGISIDATRLGTSNRTVNDKEGHLDEPGEAHETKITKREKEVIRLIQQGMSNKEIASHLEISEHTVKNHISNIFTKLGINDRNQILVLFPDAAD